MRKEATTGAWFMPAAMCSGVSFHCTDDGVRVWDGKTAGRQRNPQLVGGNTELITKSGSPGHKSGSPYAQSPSCTNQY